MVAFCLPAAESSRAQVHPSTWSQSIKAHPDTPSASVFPCQSLLNIQNNVSGSQSGVWGPPGVVRNSMRVFIYLFIFIS